MLQPGGESMYELIGRMISWTEERPPWLRPALYGPCILFGLILARGGVLAVPLVGIYLIFGSKRPLADMALGASVLALLFASAAMGGLMHSLLGRRIVRIPLVGPPLAGMIDVFPYMVALGCVIQLMESGTFLAPWDGALYFTVGGCTLIFGSLLGWGLLHDSN